VTFARHRGGRKPRCSRLHILSAPDLPKRIFWADFPSQICFKPLILLARPERFERPTPRFVVCRRLTHAEFSSSTFGAPIQRPQHSLVHLGSAHCDRDGSPELIARFCLTVGNRKGSRLQDGQNEVEQPDHPTSLNNSRAVSHPDEVFGMHSRRPHTGKS
jgi:hypothetical protein